MKHRKKNLMILTTGGMMLTCFYAYTFFIFTTISRKPFPLPAAAAVFFGAVFTTYIHNILGWRRIYIVMLHAAGFLLSHLWVCHRYYKLESPIGCLDQVTHFFLFDGKVAERFTPILIFLCVLMLWLLGIRLWTKPINKTLTRHRFDLGQAFWLLLLLIKLAIAVKGGSMSREPLLEKSLLSFIILGLFSMGLVHTKGASQKEGVTYLKGTGIVLGFVFITLALGGGLFILFLPTLQTFAEAGSGMLDTMKDSIGQALITFALSSFRPGLSGDSSPELPAINKSGGELGILHFLFIGFGIVILMFMLFLVLSLLLTWFLSNSTRLLARLKWLFSKIKEEKDEHGIGKLLLSFIFTSGYYFLTLWEKISHSSQNLNPSEKYYKSLLRWGRFSGLTHTVYETPREYGIRLGKRFPQIRKEIRLIVHAHNESVYGCTRPDQVRISRLKLAMKRIRNPHLWFIRLRFLCFDRRF